MRSNDQVTAGFLVFAGSGLFLLGMIIAEAAYPGYSISQNVISDLGVGQTALIFNSAAITCGLATISSAYFIRHCFNSRLFIILLGLSGIGILGVGLFPLNTGHIHDAFAAIAFISGSLAVVYSSKIFHPPFRYLSAYLGVFSIIAVIFYANGYFLGLGKGGMERLIVFPVIIWTMGFGGALMKPFRA